MLLHRDRTAIRQARPHRSLPDFHSMRAGCSAMDTDEPDQKDVDAFVAWLTKVEQAPKVLDDELSKLIEFLVLEKDKFLPKLTSSKKDQEFFDNELERMNSVRHTLRLMDETLHDASLKADLWGAVVAIFVAGINLGQYSEPIDIVKKELNSERQRNNSKLASKAKADKAEIEWGKTALMLAGMAQEAGKRSQSDIAEYITAHWSKHSKNKCPKHSTLVTAISNWQHKEKLQK